MLMQYQKVSKDLQKHVRTDLTFRDFKTLLFHYRHSAGNIKSDQLQGKDAWIDGGSYQIATTKELNRVSNNIRHELELANQEVDNAEVYQNENNPYFDGVNNQTFYISSNFNNWLVILSTKTEAVPKGILLVQPLDLATLMIKTATNLITWN